MREPENRHRPVPGFVGIPMSWLYRAAIGRVNRRFDRGRGVVTFDRPVISVGNLSVGGTGKTPMVLTIARWLIEAGHLPCIAMRGYKGADGGSDEADQYRREAPDVPVVAQANRTLGLIQLFSREHEGDGPHSDCILLDDGFQHRQIARQLDVVLIDATRSPFKDSLLPAGWLREPVESLKRAGAIVITHAERVGAADITEMEGKLAGVSGAPVAVCRHVWTGLRVRRDGVDQEAPLQMLAGQRIVAACAIGNPEAFMAAAERACSQMLAARFVFPDHDPYSDRTVQRIIEAARSARAAFIVTTDKDWSKLARVSEWPCPVVRPRLELAFDRGESQLRSLVLDAAGMELGREIEVAGDNGSPTAR